MTSQIDALSRVADRDAKALRLWVKLLASRDSAKFGDTIEVSLRGVVKLYGKSIDPMILSKSLELLEEGGLIDLQWDDRPKRRELRGIRFKCHLRDDTCDEGVIYQMTPQTSGVISEMTKCHLSDDTSLRSIKDSDSNTDTYCKDERPEPAVTHRPEQLTHPKKHTGQYGDRTPAGRERVRKFLSEVSKLGFTRDSAESKAQRWFGVRTLDDVTVGQLLQLWDGYREVIYVTRKEI